MKNMKTIAVAATAAIALTASTAGAASLITSSKIADGTIMNRDIHRGTISENRLDRGVITKLNRVAAPAANGVNGTAGTNGKDGQSVVGPKGATGATGPQGATGPAGKDGKDGNAALAGAYYSVAFYDVGDTNAGAIATVACKAQTDTAISGGVQTLGLDADANSRNTPVSSSFVGRMDWTTNTPKVGRNDGWIVQFGGNAGAVSDKAPEKVKVYALCVPGLTVPVEQTFTQSS